ncbi:MAG: hypothetical protein LUE93_03480 [Bacteroides sp.]|nr:hypothetical protein [Bacteroides sp.]
MKELDIASEQPLLVNDVISCTGADTCRLGICLAKGAARAVRNHLLKSNLPPDEAGALKINISGCSNSCAQHVWSDPGFSGRVARNDRMFPAYSVYAKTEGPGELAQSVGSVSARDLPVFVEELLAAYLDHKEEYVTFGEYIRAAGKVRIAEILARYAEIPSFEEGKNYYYDWGSDQVFSVSERGKTECSAGLFDMIDIDGNILESSRKALQEATDRDQINDILYDMAHSASRMLLITRGGRNLVLLLKVTNSLTNSL